MMIIYTMQMYKGMRMVENLKWGRRDKDMTQHGSHYNKGSHKRYVRTTLEDLRKAFKEAKKQSK